MKKYIAIMVAVLFAFGTTGMALAQQQKQDTPAKPIEGKKTEGAEKRQAVTPDKKKAAEAPATGEGQAKSDKKEVKKTDKSKKRQAQTTEKTKAAEAPKAAEGQAAPPAAPAKK
jgi:hypothetical protein